MTVCRCVAVAVLLTGVGQGTPPTPPPTLIPGTLDALVTAGERAQFALRLSTQRDLPGVADGDRVFRGNLPQFRPAGTRDGLLVAYVETRSRAYLFVDTNVDGRLTEGERQEHVARPTPTAFSAAAAASAARMTGLYPDELALEVVPGAPGAVPLPFRARVLGAESPERRVVQFTAGFRAEGFAMVDGRRVRVSLPFDTARGTADFRSGRIGLDANVDGVIDFSAFDGPEVAFVRDERHVFRAGNKYVSFESVDYANRSFQLREHPAGDYLRVEIVAGQPMVDFEFTDLMTGTARRLSDYKGKWVLLDFWGTWCSPCVAEIPHLKTAYARFRAGGLEIIGMDLEHSATADQVRAFVRAREIPWTITAPDSVKTLIQKRLRIQAFPTYILIDRAGRVVDTAAGALQGERLVTTLASLLGG